MKLSTTLAKLCSNHMVIFTVLAALVLIYLINMYSGKKSLIQSAMTNNDAGSIPGTGNDANIMNPQMAATVQDTNKVYGTANSCAPTQQTVPAAPLGQNSGPAGVSGVTTDMHGLPPSCTQKPSLSAPNLLPSDNNNEFSKMNPMGAGDVANVSLLKAGYHIGIDTVGQSLRNANLQIRSEPANPQLNTGPWNTSTIGPDFNRRPMEIGCGPN
jgi:hypothetical protein